MELLESSVNRKSGGYIRDKIIEKAKGFTDATNGRYGADAQAIKRDYHLVFEDFVTGTGTNMTVTNDDYWLQSKIEVGNQVEALNLADADQLAKKSDAILVFPTTGGGIGKGFEWTAEDGATVPVTDKIGTRMARALPDHSKELHHQGRGRYR